MYNFTRFLALALYNIYVLPTVVPSLSSFTLLSAEKFEAKYNKSVRNDTCFPWLLLLLLLLSLFREPLQFTSKYYVHKEDGLKEREREKERLYIITRKVQYTHIR